MDARNEEEMFTVQSTNRHHSPGLLSQKEFARLTDRFILLDPVRESLHNQLICAIYTNASREPPEAGVASWVSSNDKHGVNGVGGAGLKHVGGDLAEHRLRVEVMQLPPRVRGRLKGIVDVSSKAVIEKDHGGPGSLQYSIEADIT